MEEERYEYWQNGHLEEAYRPPALVTLVFVVTMLAIYLMGRDVERRYPEINGPDPISLIADRAGI